MLKKDLGLFLEKAIEKNDEKLVKRLIEGNADVTLEYKDKNSVLHLAMEKGKRNPQIVKMLLKAKADPLKTNTAMAQGWFSKKENVDDNYWKCFRVFATVLNKQSMPLGMALLYATAFNKFDIAKSLLNASARTDLLNFYEGYPLHYAVRNENASMIFLLLESGADPEQKCNSKIPKTPLELARESDFYEGMRAFATYQSFSQLRKKAIDELGPRTWCSVFLSPTKMKLQKKLSEKKTFNEIVLFITEARELKTFHGIYYYEDCLEFLKRYLTQFVELGNEEPCISIDDALLPLFESRKKKAPEKNESTRIAEIYPSLFKASPLPSAPMATETTSEVNIQKPEPSVLTT